MIYSPYTLTKEFYPLSETEESDRKLKEKYCLISKSLPTALFINGFGASATRMLKPKVLNLKKTPLNTAVPFKHYCTHTDRAPLCYLDNGKQHLCLSFNKDELMTLDK